MNAPPRRPTGPRARQTTAAPAQAPARQTHRLYLEIGDGRYRLRRLAGSTCYGWTLTKPDGVTVYAAAHDTETGKTACTCEGFKHRGDCKHVRALVALGIITPSQETD